MSHNLDQQTPAPSVEERLRAIIVQQESKINEMADIVAEARHGINNPLTGIIGQIQILLRSDLAPELRHSLESIEQLALRVRDTAALLRPIQRAPDAQDAINWAEK
jgi:signal transduction histidine kinase